MPTYKIAVTEEAQTDLGYYTAFERKIIVSQIRERLSDQPKVETKNRKQLRENPIASWELRIGKYRVFYDVPETVSLLVVIVPVGHKDHNSLVIRGKEVQL